MRTGRDGLRDEAGGRMAVADASGGPEDALRQEADGVGCLGDEDTASPVRALCVYLAVLAFVVLGALDIAGGDWRPGVASVCLAVANALLLL